MAKATGLEAGDAVVVTGASQGIGRAIALDLAARGAKLALWDVTADKCAETAAMCRKAGAQAIAAGVDVSDRDQVLAAAEKAAAAYGSIFGLVSNAGIFPRASILESTPQMWRDVLGVNLLGNVFCAQAVLPSMIAAKRGAIVTVASGRALQGTPRGAHYAASKAAIVSFTKLWMPQAAWAGVMPSPWATFVRMAVSAASRDSTSWTTPIPGAATTASTRNSSPAFCSAAVRLRRNFRAWKTSPPPF